MRNEKGQWVKGYKNEYAVKRLMGEESPHWKGGRSLSGNGYWVVYAQGHPRANRNKVYEHIIVAEKKIGRFLERGEQVHHINGDKQDNKPDNLVVCKSCSEHLSKHRIKTWSILYDKCRSCGTRDRKHNASGLCWKCYEESRKGIPKKPRPPCNICDKPSVGFGYCMNHYRHFKKYGDPLLTKDAFRNIIREIRIKGK